MEKDKLLNHIQNEEGQAIFEFVIFLPIMIVFYQAIVSIAGSINGSINQQKATRAIVYSRAKGSPLIPMRRIMERQFNEEGMQFTGIHTFVYADDFGGGGGNTPIAHCYKVPAFGTYEPEECDQPYDDDDNSSPHIVPKTAYGLCGQSYIVNAQGYLERDYQVSASRQGCEAGGN